MHCRPPKPFWFPASWKGEAEGIGHCQGVSLGWQGVEDAFIRAEGADGGTYEVSEEGFPHRRPTFSAGEWLGVKAICG